jgi:hypothetical protein
MCGARPGSRVSASIRWQCVPLPRSDSPRPPFMSASRHENIWLRVAIIHRVESSARRDHTSAPGTTPVVVSGGRGSRQSECCGNAAARKASRARSNTTEDDVRKQCSTARTTNEPEMNVQHRTLQNVKGSDLASDKVFADDNRPLQGAAMASIKKVLRDNV